MKYLSFWIGINFYSNLYNRAADSAGFAYWKGQLDNGIDSRGTVMASFAEEKERTMFKELINVSGVGANTALMILSSMKPDDVVLAVDQSNVEAFKSIKGIGLKSAQRIIVDLKGKLEKIESINDILSSQDNTLKNEALSALVVLGIDKKKANKAIDEILSNEEVASVEELIKKTLKAV